MQTAILIAISDLDSSAFILVLHFRDGSDLTKQSRMGHDCTDFLSDREDKQLSGDDFEVIYGLFSKCFQERG